MYLGSSTRRPFGVIGMRNRRSKNGHDRITDMLVYTTTILFDDIVHFAEELIQQRMQIVCRTECGGPSVSR